jgi:hypothetical protein
VGDFGAIGLRQSCCLSLSISMQSVRDCCYCDDVLLAAFDLLDRADLARVCLASKRLRCLAYKALYREVQLVGVLKSREVFCGLHDALVLHGEYPAQYVRTLQIDFQVAPGERLYLPPAAAKLVSSALINLHTLVLGEAFDNSLGAALINVTLPSLRKLVLNYPRGLEPFVARHAAQITHWNAPTLNVEVMRGIPNCQIPYKCQHLNIASPRLVSWFCLAPCALRTLGLSLCHFQRGGGFGINTEIGKQMFTLLAKSVLSTLPFIDCLC